MKITFLLLMLQTAAFYAFGQKHDSVNFRRLEPINTMRDRQEYQGYSIRLLPAMPTPGNIISYGFDILKDNKLVVHQVQNPLSFSAKGIQKKEDAYKIAQWMIRDHTTTGHWQNIVLPDIARELKIESY